jgi:hypothetical protein
LLNSLADTDNKITDQEDDMDMVGKSFRVKSNAGMETIISIVDVFGNNLLVHMTSNSEWGKKESTEHLSKDLFYTCIRTGYLAECA